MALLLSLMSILGGINTNTNKLECSSSLNFATSQPLTSDPASSPTGALVSNQIYLSNASALPNSAPPSKAVDLLPDLAAQIQEYINLPPTKFRPTKTYYVVSFGLWNIYHTAGLDIKVASNITDLSVSEIFKQLDILQNHVVQNLTENLAREIGLQKREEQEEDETFETLKVILPKLFDPSLLPGWFTQRPRPLAPSSIAEQQRNSITLTGRWNDRLEAEMPQWLFASDHDAKPLQGKGHNGKDIERWEVHTNIKRDIYFPEVPAHLLSLITENQVQSIGISDASGVGTREDISEHVSTPCVTDSLEDGQASWSFGGLPELQEGRKERDGKMVCKHPDKYLFWDAWTLGRKAKEQVAEMVKGIVVEERGMRSLLEEGMDSEDGEE